MIGLVGAMGLMLTPFAWMLATSGMQELEVFQNPPALWPSVWQWRNYRGALTAQPFDHYFLNSTIVASLVVAGQLVTSATAGYAFARLEFRGRSTLFMICLSTLMVPPVVLLIPRFLLVDRLGWVDSYAGLASTELVSVWGVFLMRQAFRQVPRDLEDAARIDGAGPWRIFWSVAIPLVRPALATLALFAFLDAWKSLLWPLIVTRSLEMRTVEVGIASFHSTYQTNWPYQMASAVVAIAPVLLVFLFTQRYLIQGLHLTGMKE
ncbi:MAG: carbohydrate ABC transporter permease [Vicinamibacterales bacterium]